MDDYCADRSGPTPPPPWSSFSPPFSAALATHDRLVDLNLRDGAVWRFGEGADAIAVRVTGPCVSNAPAALAALAVAGRGVARCPLYAVEAALADGRLVALFPPDPSDDLPLYAVYPPNRHLTARVRALIDHLAAAFADRRWR